MSAAFIPGTVVALSRCSKCKAGPNEPCRTHRLGKARSTVHTSRGATS